MNIEFIGRTSIFFIDENDITYKVDNEILSSKKYDMLIYTEDIKPIDSNLELSDKDRERLLFLKL